MRRRAGGLANRLASGFQSRPAKTRGSISRAMLPADFRARPTSGWHANRRKRDVRTIIRRINKARHAVEVP